MIEFIKNTMLAGLGATVVTKEAIEKNLQVLVEKGKISAEDAKQTADSITEQGREQFERVKVDAETFMEDLLQKGNLVTRKQYDQLAARVAALEAKANPEHQG